MHDSLPPWRDGFFSCPSANAILAAVSTGFGAQMPGMMPKNAREIVAAAVFPR
jgi:hypothetical protein